MESSRCCGKFRDTAGNNFRISNVYLNLVWEAFQHFIADVLSFLGKQSMATNLLITNYDYDVTKLLERIQLCNSTTIRSSSRTIRLSSAAQPQAVSNSKTVANPGPNVNPTTALQSLPIEALSRIRAETMAFLNLDLTVLVTSVKYTKRES